MDTQLECHRRSLEAHKQRKLRQMSLQLHKLLLLSLVFFFISKDLNKLTAVPCVVEVIDMLLTPHMSTRVRKFCTDILQVD